MGVLDRPAQIGNMRQQVSAEVIHGPDRRSEHRVSHHGINQRVAAQVLRDAFDRVVDTQQNNIARAAGLVFDAILTGGIIQVFGTGHSRSFAMEIAGRAGGLVPANRSR